MDDQLIIQLFNNRSEHAITAISYKYGTLCKGISYRILKNERDAEECVNDAYFAAWNTIPPENPDPLSAYLCRIVRNVTLKKYRYNIAEKRNNYYDTSLEEIEECLSAISSPETELDKQELTDRINRFLETRKEIDRVIFMKRYWFCYEISEIADDLDLKVNYVNVHLHRTKEKLKRFLKEEKSYE